MNCCLYLHKANDQYRNFVCECSCHEKVSPSIKEEGWREAFDWKWKRIYATITGHISGRAIWSVDNDEDSYRFVDETIKAFIEKAIAADRASLVEQIRSVRNPFTETEKEVGFDVAKYQIITLFKTK